MWALTETDKKTFFFFKSTSSDYLKGFYFIKLVGAFVFVDKKIMLSYNMVFPSLFEGL